MPGSRNCAYLPANGGFLVTGRLSLSRAVSPYVVFVAKFVTGDGREDLAIAAKRENRRLHPARSAGDGQQVEIVSNIVTDNR